jgi:hypothetical protein
MFNVSLLNVFFVGVAACRITVLVSEKDFSKKII